MSVTTTAALSMRRSASAICFCVPGNQSSPPADRDGEIRDRFVSTGRGGYHDLPSLC